MSVKVKYQCRTATRMSKVTQNFDIHSYLIFSFQNIFASQSSGGRNKHQLGHVWIMNHFQAIPGQEFRVILVPA